MYRFLLVISFILFFCFRVFDANAQTIAASPASGIITACAGTASASPSVQQFTISGNNLTADVTATAPVGFEISLSATGSFGNTVIIAPTGGVLNNTIIYARSAASASIGNISGDVSISSVGVATQLVLVVGRVNAIIMVNAAANKTFVNGTSTNPINFTGTGNGYSWVNDTPGIGLAASGTGNIPAFTAVNTSSTPITATITVTPASADLAYVVDYGVLLHRINSQVNDYDNTIIVGRQSLGISVSPDGSKVYVTSPKDNKVTVVDAGSFSVLGTIDADFGPAGIVVSPDGSKIYVALENTNSVAVIDASSNTVIKTFKVGSKPYGVAVSPDGSRLYVTNLADGNVSVVNTVNNTVVATVSAGQSPEGVVVSPDGKRVYVANSGSKSVTVIDATTYTIITDIAVGNNPIMVALNPTGTELFVAVSDDIKVSVISTANNSVLTDIPFVSAPSYLAVNQSGNTLFVVVQSGLIYVDIATNSISSIFGLGGDTKAFGNFVASGGTCGGTPTKFTITVNAAPPAITATVAAGSISACAGTPSTSPNIQQFAVSGTNLTDNITVNAPAGFEVSLASGSGFGNIVTIYQSRGIVSAAAVFVRSTASSPAGNISGDVVLKTVGGADQHVAVKGIVNALATVKTIADQNIVSGATMPKINFTGTGNTFTWINDTPGIGLAASGTGDITTFTAINKGSAPVKATITVIPSSVGYAYVANSSSNDVSVISRVTHSVVATIPVGYEPWAEALSPDGSRLYVANASQTLTNLSVVGSVSVINTANNLVLSTIKVGKTPSEVVVSPDGKRVYVTNSNDSFLSVIDAATNNVLTNITLPNTFGIAISPDGKWLYVTSIDRPIVSVISTITNTIVSTIPIGVYCPGIVVSPDGNTLFITSNRSNEVLVIDTRTNTLKANIGVGINPFGISEAADGSLLFVANSASKTVSIINEATMSVISTVQTPGVPYGLSVSPDGGEVYVSQQSPDVVTVISTSLNGVTDNINVGSGPVSLGNFVSAGTGCVGTPVSFTITVNPLPVIVAVGAPTSVNTIYGTASTATSFNVSGANISSGILVSPPPGFEVSTDNVSFSSTTLVGGNGSITPIPIYLRLTSKTAVGNYFGSIILSSAGATSVNIAMPSSPVNPAPLTITANNVNKTYGTAINGIAGSIAFGVVGLQNAETIGSLSVTYGAGASAGSQAGRYPGSVIASAATDGTFNATNYSLTYVPGDIIVETSPLTIAADNKAKFFGAANPVLTASYGGFLNNDTPAQLTKLPVLSTVATNTSPVGQYPIDIGGAQSPNYSFIYLPGILTVNATSEVILIPNTFTPNNDSYNDTWDIKYLDTYPNATVEIFNRYGDKVYSSIGYPVAWDGKYKGTDLPVGTYYYIINPKNGRKVISGSVTIIR